MIKIIAVFNLVASAVSISGFLLVIQASSFERWMAIPFGLAFLMSCYVLFVPNTNIEKNVAAKLRHFEGVEAGSMSTEQTGEFSILDDGPTRIKFHIPFSSPPQVEVFHSSGKSGPLPTVSNVTVTGAQFRLHTYTTGFTKKFQWVAFGPALKPLEEESNSHIPSLKRTPDGAT